MDPAQRQDSHGGAERRQHPRARADWPITIVLDDGVHEAKIRDVSRGGVCFFLDRPVPEMTALRLSPTQSVQAVRGLLTNRCVFSIRSYR